MKFAVFFLVFVVLCNASGRPWMNAKATPKERAQALLAQMTLDEKLAMVRGYSGPYVGNVQPNARLKIPTINLEDGPQGVADGVKLTTCWPSALTVVASWDTQLMYQWGVALGKEQRMKGTNVMLGPMINIARVPVGGRNFESFGEDPVLAATMVGPSVKGIQSQGVIACAKHYVDNNQEYHRTTVSENVDERTQHEIYMPAFKAAVDAGVGSFMCGYNKVNNVYACENNYTLNTVLKDMWGYEGWVMSDWGATHSTVLAANSGLDQQMPDASFFGANLKIAINNGQVPMSRLNDMVVRILTPMFAVGIFDKPQTGDLGVDSRSAEHSALARELASAGTVLAKNTGGALPLSAQVTEIAVLGDDGKNNPIFAGGGSGHVENSYIITPFDGIAARAGTSVNVTYAATNDLARAVQLAQAAEAAIVFVGTSSSEGSDRTSVTYDAAQTKLIQSVCAVQKRTIVVTHLPGATAFGDWADCVAAIVIAWLPGQEDGHAIADILYGDVNPSGRLPVSFPAKPSDNPVASPSQYPGINDQASYSEKLLVGYRWFDAKSVAPLFPFGHGLSYTTFTYSDLAITGRKVALSVKNTGKRDGYEVVQLYIGYPSSAGEPPKALRGFQKVSLPIGVASELNFQLSDEDLSIWDVSTHSWSLVHGSFSIYVGASSRDIRLTGTDRKSVV